MQQPSLEEVFGSYMAWKLDDTTWCINFMNGTQNLYLLEGEEKALLLDTGYGTGTLRGFVESLTDKEIIVANTHFHPDHSAGNGEFETVYVSKGAEIDASSINGFGPFDLNKLPYANYEKIYIGEGYKIELGGRTVEVLEALPAHCNSSLFFLDRGHKMFFTGDELEAAQVLLYDNSNNPDAPYDIKERLDNFYKNNKRILELAEQYDYLLPNHNGVVIAKSYAQEFMELVQHIYEGDAVIEEKLNHKFIEMDPKAPELCRVRYKNASIFIKKLLLMKVYGK
jgi:Zn-dependent hydrolases, including glyoxylases